MTEQTSFKERVRKAVISNAYLYKRYYVDYEYLLCSKAFVGSEYYIVAAYEDNYLHLTGLHTNLDAGTFFEKCYKGTLKEDEFDFFKKGQNENVVKGSVRRKIEISAVERESGHVKTFQSVPLRMVRRDCYVSWYDLQKTVANSLPN